MEKLYDKLTEYCSDGYYPFHMPGHKRSREFASADPYSVDITEIEGFDNLHSPEGVIAEAQTEAARLYHAMKSYLLVNGSSGGLLTSICACSQKGSKVLVARNCHVSVFNAVILNELTPVYVRPQLDSAAGLALGVSPHDVEAAFEAEPDICLAVITSPTYDGFISDIEAVSRIVHAHGALLIVDAAHGAHLGFHDAFPPSPTTQGADIVVQSLHKTLPSLTQTALLHICSPRVNPARIKLYFDIFHTTSPSYILMSSIQRCLDFLCSCENAFSAYVERLNDFYKKTSCLTRLQVFGSRPAPGGSSHDFGKILIFSGKTGMTGRNLYDILIKDYKLQPEMASMRYCLCMTSVCDTQEGFGRLADALFRIDRLPAGAAPAALSGKKAAAGPSTTSLPITIPGLPPQKMRPGDAAAAPGRLCIASEAVGCASAGFIYAYPPGCPLLVPGEILTGEILEFISECAVVGLTLSNVAVKDDEIYINVLE